MSTWIVFVPYVPPGGDRLAALRAARAALPDDDPGRDPAADEDFDAACRAAHELGAHLHGRAVAISVAASENTYSASVAAADPPKPETEPALLGAPAPDGEPVGAGAAP